MGKSRGKREGSGEVERAQRKRAREKGTMKRREEEGGIVSKEYYQRKTG